MMTPVPREHLPRVEHTDTPALPIEPPEPTLLEGQASSMILPAAEDIPRLVETGALPDILAYAYGDRIKPQHELEPLAKHIQFADIVVPYDDRHIRNQELFEIVPLTPAYPHFSHEAVGENYDLELRIRTTYPSLETTLPYLDTGQALGLAYDESLIAIAGAHITHKNVLSIVQLQDVTGVRKSDGKAYYTTGLHNGFLWRDTLVTGWEKIGGMLGVTALTIQSNANNGWKAIKDAGGRGYDDVARRMGYVMDPDSGNWIKPVEPTT